MHSGAVEFSAADFDATAASNGSGPANNFGTVIEFDDNFIYGEGDLGLLYTHSDPLALNGSLVTSGADAVSGFQGTTNGVDGTSGTTVRSIFGDGFDASEESLGTSNGFGAVVQFSVTRATTVPEPSSMLGLMGLAGLFAVKRRRR